MDAKMETNKWLWQPHKNGPIHLRLTYRDAEGKLKTFTRTLNTNHYPTARKVRDTEFLPIINGMNIARTKLELIDTLFPDLEDQLQRGVHGGYSKGSAKTSETLTSLHQQWSEALTVSGGNYAIGKLTAGRYRYIASLFVAFAGATRPAADVTGKDIARYRDDRLTNYGIKKKTMGMELTALRSMFRFGIDHGFLDESPAVGITVSWTRAERIRARRDSAFRPPTHDEADRICTQFPATGEKYSIYDFQDYGLFARYTGMRQGELAHISVKDLQLYLTDLSVDQILKTPKNYEKQFKGTIPAKHVLCIYVRDTETHGTKTGLERIVPVAKKLLPALKRRAKQVKTGPLFPFAARDSCASFGRKWVKCVKAVDAGLTMHGFRHYATSEMENNGVNAAISSIILGHSQGTVHDTYFHKQIGSLKDAVDEIY